MDPTATGDEAAASWRARLAAGLRYVRQQRVVGGLLAGQAAAVLCFSIVVPIEVVFVKSTLGGGAAGYGALLASWGAGMVLGAGVFALAKRAPAAFLIVGSTLLVAISYVLIGVSGSLVAACLAILPLGEALFGFEDDLFDTHGVHPLAGSPGSAKGTGRDGSGRDGYRATATPDALRLDSARKALGFRRRSAWSRRGFRRVALPAALAVAESNFGAYPMSNGLARLASRFLASPLDLERQHRS